MKLAQLISDVEGARVDGDASVEISGVAIDSRAVRPGNVFVAVRGTKVDGHRFVGDAIARGAAAVVAEEAAQESAAVPTVVVDSSARALALVAGNYYGNPARRLTMCGVTGTNGKTSVSHMIRAIMGSSRLGEMGIVGTLGHGVGELAPTIHTTPDAVTLHRLFRDMVDANCFGVVMEVSSHAVRQHRTYGLDFEVGILTNVTHDHLDFHPTMDDYRAAKREFCESLIAAGRRKPAGVLVYSYDDPVAKEIGQGFAGRKVSVGRSEGADTRIVSATTGLDGTELELALSSGDRIAVRMKLLGTFVPENASLAAAAAIELGATPVEVGHGLEALASIPGRFEALGGSGRPVVVIDYSHTPDAFERVLSACRDLGPRSLTVVFGCGGDRDRAKRPLIGAVAERLADRCIVTTDNPRTEPVRAIVDEILAGMKGTGDVSVELDRATAIATAVAGAGSGDLVALLGKGHESYQIIGTAREPFSDRTEAERALAAWSQS